MVQDGCVWQAFVEDSFKFEFYVYYFLRFGIFQITTLRENSIFSKYIKQ